jgi:hypothetical protein
MNYKITSEQLDRVLFPFFEKEFKHAEWGEHDDSYGGGKWYGYVNQDGVLLVGHPSHDDSVIFTNGQHFSNMWDLFSVDPQDFNESMLRFMEKKYGKTFNEVM